MDNLSRFFSYTGVNPNISQFGQSVEEIKIQRGAPDADPVASPMPNTSAPNALLALSRDGSDRLRFQSPEQPEVNPYAGATQTLFLNRNALLKLDSSTFTQLAALIQNGSVGTPETRPLMGDSMTRVAALKGSLQNLASMAMAVAVQTRAVARA